MLYVLPYGQMSLWGESNCPTCSEFIYSIFASFVFIAIYYSPTLTAKRVRATVRIGPHDKDILSIIYGSLLGEGQAEYRMSGFGTRISFVQESNHEQYLL